MIRPSTIGRTNRRSAVFAVALAAAFLLIASGRGGPRRAGDVLGRARASPDRRRPLPAGDPGVHLRDRGRLTEVDGYRGRIEAELLLGRYADALADYNRVTTTVLPAHPDAGDAVLAGYAERSHTTPTTSSR